MKDGYLIKNEKLIVRVKRKGAELCSVTDNNGTEFIWQAGEVWRRHAPNLFPAVGSLIDHEYIFHGETYPLKHHGFARDMNFDMLHQSEHSICLVLQHTNETLQSYPFKFTLLITYSLNKSTLKQTFRVINEESTTIPVSFGGHPAFNADPIEDFEITFNQSETIKSNTLEGPYIGTDEIEVIENNKITLNNSIFDNDALIFKHLKSDLVTLKHMSSDYEVQVDISEFPYLGIWAKPGAPYVCIEPWQGLADHIGHNKDILDKEGIAEVEDEISRSFSMTFRS